MKIFYDFIRREYLQMMIVMKKIDEQGIAHNKLEKLKYCIDFDHCTWKYHIDENEYFVFKFYDKNTAGKKKYLSDTVCGERVKEVFNNTEAVKYLDDKVLFNQLYSEKIGRNFILLNGNNFEEFCEFCNRYTQIIVKPLDESCGKGIRKISVDSSELSNIYSKLIEDRTLLVEQIIVQNKEMGRLNKNSVNTVRVLTVRDKDNVVHIPFANIRIGRKVNDVDNFHFGGLTASVDCKTGIVITQAVSKSGDAYAIHPDSGEQIVGFQIPCWDKIIKTVVESADKLSDVRIIGWDVAIDENNNICLIEGNSNPDLTIFERTLEFGIKPIIEEYLWRFKIK